MTVAGADLSILEGAQGWLFLERYANMHPLRSGLNLDQWREHSLPILKTLFEGRARRASARGARFLAMAAPEKSSIYPEMLPPEFRGERPSAAERLVAECRESGVDFLDLTEILRRAKGAVDLYDKTDSHWSVFGAWTAYKAIADAVRRHLPIPVLGPERLAFRHHTAFGDLSVHMSPERPGTVQTVEITGPEPDRVIETWDERQLAYQEFAYDAGVGTALVVRDSFSNRLAPFLVRTFAKTVFVAPAMHLLDDMVEELRPDVILFEVAERVLFYPTDTLADWSPVGWRKIFLESLHEVPGFRLNQQTRLALTENRPGDAVETAAKASLEDSEHRFAHNYAHGLLLDGRPQQALEVCDAALARHPDERGLHYRRARALHDLGRLGEAIAALRSALALQPANALYLNELNAWLGEAGDHRGVAAAQAQTSIELEASNTRQERGGAASSGPVSSPKRGRT